MYLCAFFLKDMFYENVIRPFIKEIYKNPDKTAAKIGNKIITNSQVLQLIAPIMNELDALSIERVGIFIEKEINVYAAIIAAMFNNITVIPIFNSLNETQIDKLRLELGFSEILTSKRMHYYYWMTYEDALCRIDNGLYSIPDEKIILIDSCIDKHSNIIKNEFRAGDFKQMKKFSYLDFFNLILPNNTEPCFTF